jgi:hypothetical protein
MTPQVACEPRADGWSCVVTVGDDPNATRHEVTVDAATLADLAPHAGVEELVLASFTFLLEREPREAIMRHFDLPVIGRFFPDYLDEIRRRVRG